MLNTNVTNQDIVNGNSTMLEVVWYYSQCRAVMVDGTTRVASVKESKLNGNQAQANRKNGITEILEPSPAEEIALVLIDLGCYSSRYNAIEQVFQLQDKLSKMENVNLAGENDNLYIGKCLEIHEYLLQTGEKVSETVGSGKWLKEIGLTKNEVYAF